MSASIRVTAVDDFHVSAGAPPSPGANDWMRQRDERSAAVFNQADGWQPEAC